jgi:hypothetical protein
LNEAFINQFAQSGWFVCALALVNHMRVCLGFHVGKNGRICRTLVAPIIRTLAVAPPPSQVKSNLMGV